MDIYSYAETLSIAEANRYFWSLATVFLLLVTLAHRRMRDHKRKQEEETKIDEKALNRINRDIDLEGYKY